MPRVYNKKMGGVPPQAVYVGRPTIWGNPFSHIKHGTLAEFLVDSRDEAVDRYKEWLLAQPKLVARARRELSGKDLVCWCFPCRCHAQVLIEVANSPEYASFDPPSASPEPDPTPERSHSDEPVPYTGRFRRQMR